MKGSWNLLHIRPMVRLWGKRRASEQNLIYLLSFSTAGSSWLKEEKKPVTATEEETDVQNQNKGRA